MLRSPYPIPVLLLPLPYDLQGVFATCLGAFDMSEEPRMQQLPPLASPSELTPPGLKVRWGAAGLCDGMGNRGSV